MLTLWRPYCNMGMAIIKKHPVPHRVKPSFVIFDIRALWCWTSECPDVKNYKWRLNPVWYRMLYSCTRMATVRVKRLCLWLLYSDCLASSTIPCVHSVWTAATATWTLCRWRRAPSTARSSQWWQIVFQRSETESSRPRRSRVACPASRLLSSVHTRIRALEVLHIMRYINLLSYCSFVNHALNNYRDKITNSQSFFYLNFLYKTHALILVYLAIIIC